jgi:hypothetical protein
MKINFMGKFPENYNAYGEISELDEYNIKDLLPLELDEIWYWYSSAPYEGSGQMIMRKGGMYDLHDMGHCSCYGPTERVNFKGRSLDDIATGITDEYLEKEVRELLKFAGWQEKHQK